MDRDKKQEVVGGLSEAFAKAKIAVVATDVVGVGVDTPEDAVRVERLLLERANG